MEKIEETGCSALVISFQLHRCLSLCSPASTPIRLGAFLERSARDTSRAGCTDWL